MEIYSGRCIDWSAIGAAAGLGIGYCIGGGSVVAVVGKVEVQLVQRHLILETSSAIYSEKQLVQHIMFSDLSLCIHC